MDLNIRKNLIIKIKRRQFIYHEVLSLCDFADYKAGFGGKYGVQNDRVDKCAVGWEHKEDLTKHESQKGMIYIGNFFQYIVALNATSQQSKT